MQIKTFAIPEGFRCLAGPFQWLVTEYHRTHCMYKYCLECDWNASTADGNSEREVSREAIAHFVETGHTVDSLRLPPPVILEN